MDNNPYERQKGETKKAYEAFTIYRDLGIDRSIRKVAQKLGKSQQLMSRWSSQYNWVERAQAYDDEMDRLAILENEKERKEMLKEHNSIARKFLEKVKQGADAVKPETMTPNELAKWLEIAVKIERLSRGESTDISEINHSGEVDGKHEYNIFQRVDQYADIYEKLANKGSTSGSHERDDHRK